MTAALHSAKTFFKGEIAPCTDAEKQTNPVLSRTSVCNSLAHQGSKLSMLSA